MMDHGFLDLLVGDFWGSSMIPWHLGLTYGTSKLGNPQMAIEDWGSSWGDGNFHGDSWDMKHSLQWSKSLLWYDPSVHGFWPSNGSAPRWELTQNIEGFHCKKPKISEIRQFGGLKLGPQRNIPLLTGILPWTILWQPYFLAGLLKIFSDHITILWHTESFLLGWLHIFCWSNPANFHQIIFAKCQSEKVPVWWNPLENLLWLVVSTTLKNISQLWIQFPIYGKIELMFQTTNKFFSQRALKYGEITGIPWSPTRSFPSPPGRAQRWTSSNLEDPWSQGERQRPPPGTRAPPALGSAWDWTKMPANTHQWVYDACTVFMYLCTYICIYTYIYLYSYVCVYVCVCCRFVSVCIY